MSVQLDSKDGRFDENISNASWSAIIACARAYDPAIPDWNGCHDGYEWTAEQLRVMAERLEQTAALIPILRDMAEGGGVKIS